MFITWQSPMHALYVRLNTIIMVLCTSGTCIVYSGHTITKPVLLITTTQSMIEYKLVQISRCINTTLHERTTKLITFEACLLGVNKMQYNPMQDIWQNRGQGVTL